MSLLLGTCRLHPFDQIVKNKQTTTYLTPRAQQTPSALRETWSCQKVSCCLSEVSIRSRVSQSPWRHLCRFFYLPSPPISQSVQGCCTAYLYETQHGISLTCSKSEYQMHFCHSSGERKDVYRLQALGQSEDLLVENLNTNLVKEVSNKQLALFVQVRGVKFWQKHDNCHWDLHPGDVLLCSTAGQSLGLSP